ncbi:MAG: hypothetical protein RLZ98_1903 [Pseudomonadota bacterium]|jgi:ribosomal-protein-alanine N-acetyltransferase
MKPVFAAAFGSLRPAVMADTDALVELLHDPDVRRYLCDDVLVPRSFVEEKLEASLALDAEGLGLWILDKPGAGMIGIAGLQPASWKAPHLALPEPAIEILIALFPAHWGRGIASSAVRTLIDYAASGCCLSRIVAAADAPNERSHRLLSRSGFRVLGTTPGPAHENLVYDLTLAE